MCEDSALRTADFDFHGAEAVELRHSLDFREANFGEIGQFMSLFVYTDNQTWIILKTTGSEDVFLSQGSSKIKFFLANLDHTMRFR